MSIPAGACNEPEPAFPRDKIRPSNTLSFPYPMNLVINGESRAFTDSLTVAALDGAVGEAIGEGLRTIYHCMRADFLPARPSPSNACIDLELCPAPIDISST